jgi:hypothetical protein
MTDAAVMIATIKAAGDKLGRHLMILAIATRPHLPEDRQKTIANDMVYDLIATAAQAFSWDSSDELRQAFIMAALDGAERCLREINLDEKAIKH